MSSNGFLQILDLKIFKLPWLLRIGQLPRRRVVRVVAGPTGSWTLFMANGSCHDARLVDGRGVLLGLRWQAEDGQHLAAVTSVRVQAPGVGRRLLTRLRWPLLEPAAFTGPP